MRMLLMLSICLMMTINANAASFDCRKATTLIEKYICSDKQLSDLDDLLLLAYKKAKSNSSNPKQLKSQQITWLKNVRNACQTPETLKQVYTDRINVLVSSITENSSHKSNGSLSGVYTNDGGELKVHQLSANKIKFELFASYGMNTGGAEGEAVLEQNKAVFVDTEYDCRLVFYFSNNKVSIDQEGTCGMGLNVSASGDYFK
ncbi:DUF1311 domain-containing protein [Desulfonema ishimotonii]|uniref:DUF1311 domain-containing protein n=1 Tax=Desulfonema ishimotonii TaxID=45657 RepID=A0A401G0I7_9BACT|nr:lysozyme inhibitor LprI family protein [Desulfonema ishimotonii]GBC62739.1 DUF1311 domain-containing protein [Desulfonema ishimotonii]